MCWLAVDVLGRDVRVAGRQGIPKAAPVTHKRLNVGQRINQGGAQQRASIAAPAPGGIRIACAIFVRHLERHRQAVEALGDLIGSDSWVPLPRRIGIITDFSLDVGVGASIRCKKRAVQRLEARPPDGHAFAAAEENEWSDFVAVHINESIATACIHGSQHAQNFRRALDGGGGVCSVGIGPLTVQVRAARIGAQMTHHSTVRAHERHDVQSVLLQQPHGQAVNSADAAVAAGAEQPPQKALCVK